MAEEETYSGPLPVPTPESRPFWEAAKQHRLSLPHCNTCDQPFFYPRPLCPRCLGGDITWRDMSGRGKLLTFVINQRGPRRFPVTGPYVVGIVELDEGPRMMARIVDVEPSPDDVRCDMAVEVAFDDVTDSITLPSFRPAAP